MIRQGEVYRLESAEAGCAVVVQNNVFNQSRIPTVVVCEIEQGTARRAAPGNVPLEAGEAGLLVASVVNVARLLTVEKSKVGERVGELAPERLEEVLAGVGLVIGPREVG